LDGVPPTYKNGASEKKLTKTDARNETKDSK
jgi:hypothetical protein